MRQMTQSGRRKRAAQRTRAPSGSQAGGWRRRIGRNRDLGAGGSIDSESLTSPVIGFILDPTGLMYNLTLEGSKISRIQR
jgi:hypothetical protein